MQNGNLLTSFYFQRMGTIEQILRFNRDFVRRKQYKSLQAGCFPRKKLVVVTCMDTRLTELLPRAMNLRNGDVKIIKTAGAIVSGASDSVMRSILAAVYLLKVREVVIVGHHDCGMEGFCAQSILRRARRRGVSDRQLQTLTDAGVNLESWLSGFDDVRDSVRRSVNAVASYPLFPPDVPVHGMLIDPRTGRLERVVSVKPRRR